MRQKKRQLLSPTLSLSLSLTPGRPGPVDHHPALHGRPARAPLPHHGQGQHVGHDQGDGHPGEELHQEQGVPGGPDDGHGHPERGRGRRRRRRRQRGQRRRGRHLAGEGQAEVDQVIFFFSIKKKKVPVKSGKPALATLFFFFTPVL